MIGVFDSGFGGLGILEEIKQKLPQYDYLYFGDNKRAPYGDKTQEEIFEHTKKGVSFLFNKGCKIVIIACNTASTKALRKLQREYLEEYYPGRKILGIVIPTIEELISNLDKNKKYTIGLLATRSTINSGVYEKELLKRYTGNIEFINQSSPLLVPLIEGLDFDNRKTDDILKNYLNIFKNKINYLIIGCTHYHYITKKIRLIIDKDIKIINPTNIIALKLKKYLENHPEIEKTLKKQKNCIYYTTGEVNIFKKFYKNLNSSDIEVEKVN